MGTTKKIALIHAAHNEGVTVRRRPQLLPVHLNLLTDALRSFQQTEAAYLDALQNGISDFTQWRKIQAAWNRRPWVRVYPPGGNDGTVRQRRRRALSRLADDGLILLDVIPRGAVYVQLTPAGAEIAQRILDATNARPVAESLVSNAVAGPDSVPGEKRDSEDIQPAEAIAGGSAVRRQL